MAFDPSKATKAQKPNPATGITYSGAQPNPLTYPSSGGPFTSGNTPAALPTNSNTAGSYATVPGPYDPLRATLKAQNPGIPASFIDDEIDNLNEGRTRQHDGSSGANPNDPSGVNTIINTEWRSEPQKSRYEQTDAAAKMFDASTNSTNGLVNSTLGIPQQSANVANNFYNKYTQPALNNFVSAAGAVTPSDLKAESDVQGNTNQYVGTIQGIDAQRLGDTTSTNNYVTDLSNQLRGAADQTNAANSAISSTWIPSAQQTNLANSSLSAGLWNATNSTNASNSQWANDLSSAASSTNANQTAALNTLLGQVSSSNAQQDAALAQVQGQFAQLNSSDQAAYMQYLQETNPLMAQLVAQGSDPQDVATQRDVEQRYKDLSNPQVTAEERLIASQARQNFEAQDRSNREAVMSQLQGRGLQSGGLTIANMQAGREQEANDRMNAEMGLEANAQTRAMGALSGYGTEANNIRSADDAERNFQDVYKQNEAVRVGNLAQQRNNQSLQTNQAITNRDQMGFSDATTSINNNFARDYTGYQANTETNNNNFNRTQVADQNQEWTNQTNLGNTQFATTTNIGVNNDNHTRLVDTGQKVIGVNQTNLGNTGMAIGNQQAVAGDNWNRMDAVGGTLSQNAVDASNVLGAKNTAVTMPAADRQREASNAAGTLGTIMGAGSSIQGIQSGLSAEQIAAVERVLKKTNANTATTAATGLG